jgi:hypothetical protein
MKKWWVFSAAAVALLVSLSVFAGDPRPTGDEDIYPIACVDFSGAWEGDSGPLYQIEQKRCNWLRIHATVGSQDTSTTIVPDNKRRSASGSSWTGVVRHRWNKSKNYGSVLETYRTMYYSNRRVSESIFLEVVNDSLLLESVYRTIEPNSGVPRNEYSQNVFRRVSYARKPR